MHAIAASLRLATAAALALSVAAPHAQGLSVVDDINSPANSTRLMPTAPRGSEYPTHGNQQAGELNLNPADPRAQLVNGLPNNAEAGGYGSPLADVHGAARTTAQPQPQPQPQR